MKRVYKAYPPDKPGANGGEITVTKAPKADVIGVLLIRGIGDQRIDKEDPLSRVVQTISANGKSSSLTFYLSCEAASALHTALSELLEKD